MLLCWIKAEQKPKMFLKWGQGSVPSPWNSCNPPEGDRAQSSNYFPQAILPPSMSQTCQEGYFGKFFGKVVVPVFQSHLCSQPWHVLSCAGNTWREKN